MSPPSQNERTAASPEVEAMARRERTRWLTVAEAAKLRKAWQQTLDGMQDIVSRFDAAPRRTKTRRSCSS